MEQKKLSMNEGEMGRWGDLNISDFGIEISDFELRS